MKEINLREVLSNVSRTIFEPDKFISADMKIEIENISAPAYYYLLINYPIQFYMRAHGSNQELTVKDLNVPVKSLGEVRIYVKGELMEYWKTFSECWKKYRD